MRLNIEKDLKEIDYIPYNNVFMDEFEEAIEIATSGKYLGWDLEEKNSKLFRVYFSDGKYYVVATNLELDKYSSITIMEKRS